MVSLSLVSCYDKGVKDDTNASQEVVSWTTGRDQAKLLTRSVINMGPADDNNISVVIDTTETLQTIDGFGYTLTGGSACLIRDMDVVSRAALLKELFDCTESGLCVSYLRLSIGASDLSKSVFSYCDLPGDAEDPGLENFSLSQDTSDVIPVLKEILAIRQDIKIMASPWSAPLWMKSNRSSIGGSLLKKHYKTYARYFVKYIQEMGKRGIKVDAVTVQNEPLHGGNNPSMVMTASEQAEFVRDHLGPEFQSNGITTKIIIYDHNCDRVDYPKLVLADAGARQYVEGSAFHLYGGDINALTEMHMTHPDKKLYFTEQWTGGNSSFGQDFIWHIKNIMIGSTRNWSTVALEWNLANDPTFGPHTPGGCNLCLGAITIDGNSYQRNVSYYIIGQMTKAVTAGSVRIGSTWLESLPNVAFVRPDGKKVLVVLNESLGPRKICVRFGSRAFNATLGPGSASTYVWK